MKHTKVVCDPLCRLHSIVSRWGERHLSSRERLAVMLVGCLRPHQSLLPLLLMR